MQAELITIGDEILIGQTIDTNSAWMGKELNSLGIQVSQITSIKDERDAIKNALFAAEQSAANLVFITGGLGPTKDDITKHVLCEYFNTVLIRDNEVLDRIQTFFKARGREMLESNNQQADVPEACTVLLNDMGTASGMWFERNGTVFVSMPGVPYEMKHLMQDRVLPKIQELFKLPAVFHKTIMTTGIGESFLVEIIKDWETSLITEDIKIAYLPSPGIVRIRLTGQGDDLAPLQEKVLRKAKELYSLVPQHIFGEDDISMEEALGNLLKEKGQTIATAESCTGGYIAHLLTNKQGSSAFYLGGFVSYDNQVKIEVLRVDKDSIEEEGAVSETVVKQMANGARNLLKTDLAIATSGVAGPDGGTDEKPVGTVWIAIASSKGVIAKKFLFEKNRDRNIRRTALAAMSMVREVL
ncbi:MAG: competence/damage-inducible protein A [Vicingaceae bacterium]|jgi:nicotinamide-nucleotide amidase